MVITPNGRTLYTVNANDNTVTPIQRSTLSRSIPVPGGSPNSAAITPDGKTLYVGNRNDVTVTTVLDSPRIRQGRQFQSEMIRPLSP